MTTEDTTRVPDRINFGDVLAVTQALPNTPERLRPVLQGKQQPEDVLTPEELAATEQSALEDQARAIDVELKQQALNQAWFNRIPPGYEKATLADLDNQQDRDGFIGRWLDVDERVLLLAGPSGLGKSFAAYAVGNEAHCRGLHVVGWPVPELNRALRPGEDHQPGVLKQVQTCPLLVLDDLGGEKVSEWTLEQLYEVARCRTGDRRTIVTTNLPHDETRERYGDRIMDRLLDEARVVRFAGKSRRKPRLEW